MRRSLEARDMRTCGDCGFGFNLQYFQAWISAGCQTNIYQHIFVHEFLCIETGRPFSYHSWDLTHVMSPSDFSDIFLFPCYGFQPLLDKQARKSPTNRPGQPTNQHNISTSWAIAFFLSLISRHFGCQTMWRRPSGKAKDRVIEDQRERRNRLSMSNSPHWTISIYLRHPTSDGISDIFC